MTRVEELKEIASKHTCCGTRLNKTTNDSQYNRGELDFANNNLHTKDCKYYLLCEGIFESDLKTENSSQLCLAL